MTELSHSDLLFECMAFLHEEAELLDDGHLERWLELLADDVDYRIPVRTSRDRAGQSERFSAATFHMIEDAATLRARVARLASDNAWAENPPSRTRRLVGNVRPTPTDTPGEVAVRSNLFLFRSLGDSEPVIVACERRDLLRAGADRWRLARRTVHLDHTSLPMANLAVFL